MNVDSIISCNRPWLHLISTSEFEMIDQTITNLDKQLIHRFSGIKMRTLDELFNVYQQEFQFPSYFGYNWPGFSELMETLENLPSPSHLTIIENAEQMLVNDPGETKTFLRQINNIGRYWSTSVGLSKDWGSGSVSFNTVLVADSLSIQKFANLAPQGVVEEVGTAEN
ncbi:barstar family protein [Rhodococcus sp. ARC_M6]|uniref:barstar family protein n=1 Tax=Rhodococcus sp. ARC_M6 TaxID=2928852 RepID=UPI001FB2AAF7|nr:barstar family protein [Rhodococcus sp. ARC_M6]MCJ0906507.1 barstar family protein [Rhodococcus sp. ARC_M6]